MDDTTNSAPESAVPSAPDVARAAPAAQSPGVSAPRAAPSLRARLALLFAAARLDPFPLRHWFHGYSLKQFRWDTRAGANVALLDFPQGMAYAMIAGLPVQNGLYCSAISTLVGPAWASSRFVMLGPTNATAALMLGAFATLQLTQEEAVAAVPLLVLLVGLFLIAGAFLRLAALTQFVSRSVVTGYITAAALTIILNQAPSALGFHMSKTPNFVATGQEIVRNLSFANWISVSVAAATILLYVMLRRWGPKALPHAALTLVLASLLTWIAAGAWHHWLPEQTWQLDFLNPLPEGLWHFTSPRLDFEQLGSLAGAALAIAFLALLESTSIAKTLATRAGERVDINQQMLSLGAANLANACVGGMAASGSLTRSTLAAESGAQTPFASILSGVFVTLGILALAPLVPFVPRPVLAAMVILVGLQLFQREQIRLMLRTTKSDAVVFLITCATGLAFALDTGIYLGAAASIVLFLKKVSAPNLVEIAFNEQGELAEKAAGASTGTPEISIVHVEGELFFGASDLFYDQARLLVETAHPKIIILRMRNARHMDATCALALRDLVAFARQRGSDVLISGAHPDIERVLRNSGLMKILGEKNFHRVVPHNPNISTRNALKRALEILGARDANITIFAKPKTPEAPATAAETPAS